MKKTHALPSAKSAYFDDELGVVLDSIAQPIIVKDARSRFCFLNEAACRLYGRSLGELAGRTDHDILPRAEAGRIRELDELVLSSGKEISSEEQITAADGSVRHVLTQKRCAELGKGAAKEKFIVATILNITARHTPGGTINRWCGTLEGLDDGQRALQALKESEARFRAIADDAPVMIWVTDESGAATYHSRLWLETTGQTPEKAQGAGWLEAIHPKDRLNIEDEFHEGLRLRKRVRVEYRLRRADGSWAWVIDVGTPRFASDGRFLGFVGIALDITDRREAEEARLLAQRQMQHMAQHDAQTGLPNRQFLREAFKHLSNNPTGMAKAAVLRFDLDGYTAITDAYGQSTGDILLRSAAERLRKCLSDTDILAHLGGGEFVVVRVGTGGTDEAFALAHQVMVPAGAPYDVEGLHADIGVSVGVAFAPKDGQSADDIVRAAHIALHRAKASGRGSFLLYDAEMDTELQTKQQMKASLGRAIPNGELELHYQPLFNLHSRQITTCEALVRWTHPERGTVPPTEFIPVAEETGLIVPLGDWILREACRQATQWPPHVSVAVNLSPLQFQNDRLTATVRDVLNETGLRASRLQLEITESVLLDESESNLQVLREIRRLGAKIAIDDFGTGYSSLRYLRVFPVDKIKVDRSFIVDLPGRESLAIIRAVAEIGRTLGITTTVEGVDSRTQLDIVSAEGFDEVQGYLFAGPLPAEQVLRTIERHMKENRAGIGKSQREAQDETRQSKARAPNLAADTSRGGSG